MPRGKLSTATVTASAIAASMSSSAAAASSRRAIASGAPPARHELAELPEQEQQHGGGQRQPELARLQRLAAEQALEDVHLGGEDDQPDHREGREVQRAV